MGGRKDIGNAFKERLTEFNDAPDNSVWEKIETELKKEDRKKRALLFWLRFSGIILALLLLLFLNKGSLLNSSSSNKNINAPLEINLVESESPNTYNVNSQSLSNDVEQSIFDENFKNNDTKTIYSDTITSNHFKSNKSSSTLASKKDKKIGFDHTKYKVPNKTQKVDNSKSNGKNNDSENDLSFSSSDRLKNSSKISNTENQQITIFDSLKTRAELESKKKTKKTLKIEDKSKDTVQEQLPQKSKWSVYPNVSVVYYDGFEKSFNKQTSFNYGLYFNYLATEKINIRIGVNRLNLKHTYEENNNPIQQHVEYYEVPLELKYIIFSKNRSQTAVTGGFSYLFVRDAKRKTFHENNEDIEFLNKTSFNKSSLSFNIGLNFQLKIFNNFYFNLEPMFKYQFEPYSDSVDFKPYTISTHTGIEYKF